MKKKMHLYYDKEGDFLEVRIGKPRLSYYEYLKNDIFEKRDEITGKVFGYAFFNVQKRKTKLPQEIEVSLPI